MIFWYTVHGFLRFQFYPFCKISSNVKVVFLVPSEMKAKDKRHVLEDQVVQTSKDSLGEGGVGKEKIYLCPFSLPEGTILAKIKQ